MFHADPVSSEETLAIPPLLISNWTSSSSSSITNSFLTFFDEMENSNSLCYTAVDLLPISIPGVSSRRY